MNSKLSENAVITDDTFFAASLSSYYAKRGLFFPVISMPRMNRPDWESEVLKRTNCLNRLNIKTLFCKGKDFGLLAPVRKYVNADVIPLEKTQDLSKFQSLKLNHNKLFVNKSDYFLGLILALNEGKILEKDKLVPQVLSDNYHYKGSNSKKLFIIEKSKSITDISAINYAIANDFDILVLKKIEKELIKDLEMIFIKLSGDISEIDSERYLKFITKKISYIFNFSDFENQYNQIQIITNKLLFGFLIKSSIVSHLFHLQADMHLLNEYYYLNNTKTKKNNIPSFLFVDTEEEDITSEVPEIIENLSNLPSWRFYLNGKYANRQNFKVYSHFFPYDVLLITGHGNSPKARIVTYLFKSRDGSEHVGKFIEFYQFGKSNEKGKILIDRKYYPLEFDGVKWTNKKELKRKNISHILMEFIKAEFGSNIKVIKTEEYRSNKIEGINLNDGVFMGNISCFENSNNPIIILNSCSSLVEAGELVNFAVPRVLIGTLWPVFDKDAKEFAVNLFNRMGKVQISEAFTDARNLIKKEYSMFSYAMIGTLNQYLYQKNFNPDLSISKEIMVNRMKNSILEALNLFKDNRINESDLMTFLKYGEVFNKFVEDNYPNDTELRKIRREFRKVVNDK